jgi:hypothetical protein
MNTVLIPSPWITFVFRREVKGRFAVSPWASRQSAKVSDGSSINRLSVGFICCCSIQLLLPKNRFYRLTYTAEIAY